MSRKRRCFYWRGDWWAVEGASHSCYQEPAIISWGTEHDIYELFHSRGWSRELLEEAFGDENFCVQMRSFLVLFLFDAKFLPLLCLLDQFVADSAATAIHATGRQLVPLCRSVRAEDRTQILDPLINSKYFLWVTVANHASCTRYFLCWQLWMKYWID